VALEVHETAASAETEALGAELARRLEPGDVVLIAGDLGSGKTTFVRGACVALGVETRVTSPTFTIGQRYAGRLRVGHLDLYRLGSLADEVPGLLEEYLDPQGVAFIEWPGDEVAELAGADGLRVRARVVLEHLGGDGRRITIS
jgi:tRNA threonylcarbamoyladenosine biosynthesis protein TsaE